MKKNKNLTHRKLIKNEYLEENLDSPQKKPSIKKGSTSVRPKRNLNTRNMRRDESVGSDKVKEQKPEKNVVANKLYKYYALMEVNKK